MDYYSCVARRTRSQSAQYYRQIFNSSNSKKRKTWAGPSTAETASSSGVSVSQRIPLPSRLYEPNNVAPAIGECEGTERDTGTGTNDAKRDFAGCARAKLKGDCKSRLFSHNPVSHNAFGDQSSDNADKYRTYVHNIHDDDIEVTEAKKRNREGDGVKNANQAYHHHVEEIEVEDCSSDDEFESTDRRKRRQGKKVDQASYHSAEEIEVEDGSSDDEFGRTERIKCRQGEKNDQTSYHHVEEIKVQSSYGDTDESESCDVVGDDCNWEDEVEESVYRDENRREYIDIVDSDKDEFEEQISVADVNKNETIDMVDVDEREDDDEGATSTSDESDRESCDPRTGENVMNVNGGKGDGISSKAQAKTGTYRRDHDDDMITYSTNADESTSSTDTEDEDSGDEDFQIDNASASSSTEESGYCEEDDDEDSSEDKSWSGSTEKIEVNKECDRGTPRERESGYSGEKIEVNKECEENEGTPEERESGNSAKRKQNCTVQAESGKAVKNGKRMKGKSTELRIERTGVLDKKNDKKLGPSTHNKEEEDNCDCKHNGGWGTSIEHKNIANYSANKQEFELMKEFAKKRESGGSTMINQNFACDCKPNGGCRTSTQHKNIADYSANKQEFELMKEFAKQKELGVASMISQNCASEETKSGKEDGQKDMEGEGVELPLGREAADDKKNENKLEEGECDKKDGDGECNNRFNDYSISKDGYEKKNQSPKEAWMENSTRRVGLLSGKHYNLFNALVDSIWERGKMLEEAVTSTQETSQPVVEEPLQYKFTFCTEEIEPVEKSEYEEQMDDLWSEFEFAIKSSEIGCVASSMADNKGKNVPEAENNQISLCCQGKHTLILDEEIGIKCTCCSFVRLEIDSVFPPVRTTNLSGGCDKRRTSGLGEEDFSMLNGLQFLGSTSHDSHIDAKGTAWDIIPGIKDSMYPHQQEGFEFIWKSLVGSIEFDKLKNSTYNGIGGCIISHAPGTGKTRLTIVFLQTYLSLFPKCRPVIMAPASMLLTWEEEFKKWDIGIPFHNLNNMEFSGKENKLAVQIYEKNRLTRSINATRMVKLYSWNKDSSILGVSYSLYEKLVGERFVCEDDDDNGKKKKKKNNNKNKKPVLIDKEDEEIRKILVDLPGLLVLDEGHTPRNQRSRIWKALSKVKTERRVILSGTPFQNNFVELFNTLSLVRPAVAEILSKEKTFTDIHPCRRGRYSRKGNGSKGKTASYGGSTGNFDDGIEKLKATIAPFVHVHKGSILQQSLPGLRDCVIVLNPPALQKSLIANIQVSQNTFEYEHKVALISLHPSQFLSCLLSEKEKSMVDQELLERIRLNPTEGIKTRFLMEFVRLTNAMNEKVLIFSQYMDPLNLIKDQLKLLFDWIDGEEVLQMHGKLDQKVRQSLINQFNDPNSKSRILLASTKCCSEGINLVGASRVVLLDVVWNPSVERQAISRAYRLGQKKIVYTYHLITSGTSEGEKYCRQAEKDRLSELVFSSTNKETNKQKLNSVVSDDKILEEMVCHEKLKDMFEKIIYQPKEANLIESFQFSERENI